MKNIAIIGHNSPIANKVNEQIDKEKCTLYHISRQTSDKSSDNIITLDMFDCTPMDVRKLDKIETLIYIWPSSLINYDSRIEKFFKLLKDSLVKKIIFISVIDADKAKKTPHYQVEQLIKECAKEYAFLRCNMFFENLFTVHRHELLNNHELFIPAGKSKISFVSINDVAKAIIKLSQVKLANQIYNLTGSKAYDTYELANILSNTLGEVYQYNKPSARKYIKFQTSVTNEIAKEIKKLYWYAKIGFMKRIYADLEQLIQQAPMTFEQVIDNNKTIFKSIERSHNGKKNKRTRK